MVVRMNLYPGGKKKALTMSYDDGRIYDKRLTELFDSYSIRGTFHLNSSSIDTQAYVSSKELSEIYRNHEVSAHFYTHPQPNILTVEGLMNEIVTDRRRLEDATGYIIRGLSYPFGTYTTEIAAMLPSYGIEYARTISSHGGFGLPENFLLWHPTCHHMLALDKLKEFQTLPEYIPLPLLYIWGHSYEFAEVNNWDLIEQFCKSAAYDENVWYATNIEIIDYVNAMKRIKSSVDQTKLFNPSAISVWVSVDWQPLEVKAGQLVDLNKI